MKAYINPFHRPECQGSKPFYNPLSEPISYKGYLIFERIKKECFDIVKDGVCIGMNAGLNGAKRRIDEFAMMAENSN